jgi:CRP-like cAMP-binding protein
MKDETVLKGNIEFLNLGDILQLLGGNGSSGILRIMSPYAPEPALVYFDKGNPVNASSGSLSGLDALYSLFGWAEGDFEFSEMEIHSERIITKGRMGIILDGLKMLDEGHIEQLGAVMPDTRTAKYSDAEDSDPPVIWGPLVDYMYVVDEEEFYDGEALLEEGKHGNWMWVILEGVVNIVKDTPSGPMTIIELGSGSFVGSVASFLVRNHSRTYSAKALGTVQVGVLDSQRLAQEYSKISYELKAFIISIDRRLRSLMDRVVKYSGSVDELDDYLANKKKVIEQGEDEKRLFRVQQGKASVIQQSENRYTPLLHLYRDDFFGYMPFLNIGHEPEFASVLASKDLKILTLNPAVIQKEFDSISTTFKNILENVATCISSTTRILNKQHENLMK